MDKVKPFEPKWLYHKEKGAQLVKSMGHEKALGDGWEDSPAKHGVVTHPLSVQQEIMGEFFEDEDDETIEVAEEIVVPVKKKPGRPKLQE